MRSGSTRHRSVDSDAAVDAKRQRVASFGAKGKENAGDGAGVGKQQPTRRSRRLSHFATSKTVPEVADGVPSRCISSPERPSGSAWEMRDAGRDVTSLIVDSITNQCSPLDLRNAALVCKEWRSMLGYAPAVASTLRGNDASAISKMVRAEGADSAVQHHITDFIRVLERAEATDSEDYNLRKSWRPMDDHLPATTVELGLIWMCAFRLSWEDHAQQMIDAWLSVIAGGVRDVNGNMDIELDAIDFIGPRDPDLYWFIPERTDFPCMRDTVRRISDVLLPRLGEIIDRAMKMGNDIAEYDRRVPHSSRAALEAEGVLDDTCRAVRRDCDFLMAYSLVIHAVFHEFPREASVHVRSLLPLPRMKSIYTYRTIPDHADDPDHLPYVFMFSDSSIANGGVAEVIAEAIMGLGNLVKDGNGQPDGLRDFFSDQMGGELDELRAARSVCDRIETRDRKTKVVCSLPKVAASELSWLMPLSDPDGYAGGLPGFAAFDQYEMQEMQFNCLYLLHELLNTNVHFDGTLIMDILVRLVAVNYDHNVPSRRNCHPLSLVNKLACRQLADLKPHAQVIVDALDSLDPLVFDEAITAFGFLGDQAEPHLDHFLERTMNTMNTKRQETRDRVVQSVYEHRHRLNDHHLRRIVLGLMLCDITIVVTSLEVVRVLCKAEENDEHRIRIMFQMFQNMALFASIICRGDSSDGFRSPPIPPPTTDTHHLLLNGGSYLLEAMQYVFSRFPKELQDGQVELLDKYSRDWQSRIDFGYAEKESLKVSQERYYRITNLHLRVMFEKDVSPELAMEHMLEMFDNQADYAKIEAYKVARTEAFSRGRQELRNRLSQFPELAEEYDSLLSSDDEEDTLNGDDGNSDASEDIENSPALD